MDPSQLNPLTSLRPWRQSPSHAAYRSRLPCRCPWVPLRYRSENENGRLTALRARIYCAPSHLKRVFRDFSFIDGVQKRVILGSSPEAFVAPGYSLKI